MKSSIKNVGNRTNKDEAEIRTKTKIFEKNPNKGGTPAKESIARLRSLVNTLFDPKFEKEKSVLIFVVIACIRVEKRRNEVML